MQAAEWYVWAISNLPEDYHAACLIVAHQYARETDFFLPLYCRANAIEKAVETSRTLDVTVEEVELVLGLLNPDEGGDAGTEDPADFEDAVTKLVAQTGIEPDVWRSRVTLAYVARQAQALNEINGEKTPAIEYIQAEKDVGLALMEIRKEHKDGA